MKRISLLLLILLIPSGYAQSISERIDHLVREHHESYPQVGLVVSVSAGGDKIFEEGYGYSNLSFKVKTETDHKFRIGSLTK